MQPIENYACFRIEEMVCKIRQMNFRFLSASLYKNLENDKKIALKEYAINLEEKEKDILEPTLLLLENK